MYIPTPPIRLPGSTAPERLGVTATVNNLESHLKSLSAFRRVLLIPFHFFCGGVGDQDVLSKRQFSSDQSTNTNIKIGIVIAFLVPAFIALLLGFLFYYRGSIRCIKKRRRRHHRHHDRHKSTSSKSSGGSRQSDRAPPPPPPPPPPADDAPENPAEG